MIKERDRVDPSTCASPVQRLPEDSQRQPKRNHADGDAHSGERLADGPEKDPGERKGVARKRERQHDHGDAGECAPQPSVPQGRQRARPSRATRTPIQASGNRNRSTRALYRDARRVAATKAAPQKNWITGGPYTKRERRVP